MIWYALGGLIGLIFFKKKYNLSFWKAVYYGIIIIFGLKFGFAAIIGTLAFIFGLANYMDISLLAFIFSVLIALGSFVSLKKLIDQGKSQAGDNKSKAGKPNRNYSLNSGYHKPNPGDLIKTNVAGVTFEGRQDLIIKLNVGQSIKLVREPENIHDDNAIKVVVEDNSSIGYINRDLAKIIAPLMDKNNNITFIEGKISSIYQVKNDSSIIGVKIKFQLPDNNSII